MKYIYFQFQKLPVHGQIYLSVCTDAFHLLKEICWYGNSYRLFFFSCPISHIERNSTANGCHDRVSAKDDTHYLITYIYIYIYIYYMLWERPLITVCLSLLIAAVGQEILQDIRHSRICNIYIYICIHVCLTLIKQTNK